MFKNLTPRERVLAKVVAGLGGVFLLFFVWSYFYNAYRSQSTDFSNLTVRQGEIELNEQRAKLAAQRRVNYRELSLHPDPDVAMSLYNAWLLKTVAEFGLSSPTVTKMGPYEKKYQQRIVAYESRFIIKTEGDINELTRFLYHFHATNILHRITDLNIQPERAEAGSSRNQSVDANKLTLNLTIEMLTIPDAIETTEITTNPGLLPLDSLERYTSVILPRNMFGFPNNPPEFSTKETQTAEAGDKISFDLRAKDADDNELSFEMLESDIAGATLTPSSNSAKVTAPSQEVGEYHFKFRVTDDHPDQKSAELEVVLQVDEPPPPKPVEVKVEPPPFDPSSRTVITGLVRDGAGQQQVWINVKPTGERLKLTVGDEFKVGPHSGRVIEFSDGGVVVEVDEKLVFFKTKDQFDKPRELPAGYEVD